MLFAKYSTFFLFVHLMIVSAQINLYFTDEIKENIDDTFVQHHCFYFMRDPKWHTEVLSFCMSESALKWHVEKTNVNSVLTFAQLNQKKITSEQLYRWSAPIDIVERYQFYLNQLSAQNRSLSIETDLFYNCTSLAFGPQCQYKLDIPNLYPSMHENIERYYEEQYESYLPMTMTCYAHLKCDRGITSVCLDWTEVCDGKVDCNDGIDEQNCWPLTTNVCEDNEYRCDNGQCIPLTSSVKLFHCLDLSDARPSTISYFMENFIPSFGNEDNICSWHRWSYFDRFTSSCKRFRRDRIVEAMFSTLSTTTNLNNTCILALQCYDKILRLKNPSLCSDFCQNDNCLKIIENTCSDIFYYPTVPIAFNHIYFAYTKQYIINSSTMNYILPEYICYNEQMCGGFLRNVTLLRFQGRTCHRREDFQLSLKNNTIRPYVDFVELVYSKFSHCNRIMNDNSTVCNSSVMYQCKNSSKCIPISYVGDGIRDCDYEDDEKQSSLDQVCSLNNNIKPFYKCANENPLHNEIKQIIHYSRICDGNAFSGPFVIDGQIHTDETECEQWPCVNRRTRCNGVWNCPNGADELDCYTSPPINCSSNHHICVSLDTNDFMCLPLEKVNDNVTDCLGGIDEQTICQTEKQQTSEMHVYCQKDSSNICLSLYVLCNPRVIYSCNNDNMKKYCKLLRNYPDPYDSIERIPATHFDNSFDLKSRSSKVDLSEKYYCYHGLPLQVVLNSEKGLTTKTCLCPPSYYGDRCQYQNQRVSLILQVKTPASSVQTPFLIIVSLIDNSVQRIIHSYWELSLYDGYDKSGFNIQLVYSNRPKDLSKQYFIQIDIYEMISLRYRGSMFTTVKFPFLPVERVVIEIDIPKVNDMIQSCDDDRCNHGQCIYYLNEPNNYFCRCQSGWTGKYCDIPHTCSCSFDSLCVGATANNRSICLCSLGKFGSKCLLSRNICQPNPCLNGGFCAFGNSYMPSVASYVCICPMGFGGKRCEEVNNKIFVSFDQNIQLSLPSQIFFYFIDLDEGMPHVTQPSSTIVCGNESSIINYYKYFFERLDILIIQLSLSELHLIENDKKHQNSSISNVTVNPLSRCPSIHEIFNESIANMHLIRRIKHYNVPCQNRSLNLRCFHDGIYVCLCQDFGDQRLADCVQLKENVKISNPIFTYDEMEHLCFANNQIDFLTYSTSSTTSLISSTPNKSNITKSPVDITISSNSACIFSFNIFILLFCLFIH